MQTSPRAGGAGRGAPHQLRVPRARFTRIIPRLSQLGTRSNIKGCGITPSGSLLMHLEQRRLLAPLCIEKLARIPQHWLRANG